MKQVIRCPECGRTQCFSKINVADHDEIERLCQVCQDGKDDIMLHCRVFACFGIAICLALLCFGCASGQTIGSIEIGTLHQDLFIVDIASNSQMDVADGTKIDAEITAPISGIPTPIDVSVSRVGLLSGQSLKIGEVRGRIIIQRALVSSHNIDLPEALSAIFIPSISPLGDFEMEETIYNYEPEVSE